MSEEIARKDAIIIQEQKSRSPVQRTILDPASALEEQLYSPNIQ